jgi:hypothetical protein
MRRESSTVVVLVGEVAEGLLGGLGRSVNVSVARAPADGAGAAAGREATAAGRESTAGREPTAARPGWETGALALREAARRQSTYVLVPDDPLADVAAEWRAMWEGLAGPAAFEARAAEVLAAWRDKRFELPDYYLVVPGAQPGGTGADMYLGPLRAVRPRRVAVAGMATDSAVQQARLLDALGSLQHGPWWPPLDELLGAARRFNAAGLAETQLAPA